MKIKKLAKKTLLKVIAVGAITIGVTESIKLVTATNAFIEDLGNLTADVVIGEEQETTVNTYKPESGCVGGIQVGVDGTPIFSVESSGNNVVTSPEFESTELETETTQEPSTEAETKIADIDEVGSAQCYISLTEEEQYQLATLIWLEGRGEPIEGQKAIASVVINRYTTKQYTGKDYSSILDVIHEESQFSPAHLIDDFEPTQLQIDVVTDIMTNGPSIPEYVTFFRAYHYHDWDNQMKYDLIGETYFSYDLRLFEKWAADHPGYENIIHVPTN